MRFITPFLHDVKAVQKRYKKTGDCVELYESLLAIAPSYAQRFGLGDYLLRLGEDYIDSSDHNGGMAVIRAVFEAFPHVANQATLYLRMAQYHLENGETEAGTALLRKLCTETVDNYEEAIAHNGLTTVWETWRHLVAGCVSPAPACSRRIEEIWGLPEEEILPALSEHLGEQTERNRWEQTVFYADELVMEVNSGGFAGYLYYSGEHFAKAQTAFEELQVDEMRQLMERLQNKFPRGHVPKDLNSIQNALDKLEEAGIDFEAEDAFYYDTAEPDLLKKLLAFALQNKEYFR